MTTTTVASAHKTPTAPPFRPRWLAGALPIRGRTHHGIRKNHESLILGVLGHEVDDVNVKHYTIHKPTALRRAIESVSFPTAQALPRVYRRPGV